MRELAAMKPCTAAGAENRRLRMYVTGEVQGVGFRPSVYRLAGELGLTGWIRNTTSGAVIEAEGAEHRLKLFQSRLRSAHPPFAGVRTIEPSALRAHGDSTFQILPSVTDDGRGGRVMPDLATCDKCLDDIRDPANRRFRYPFTNCTDCGPRFSIMESIPYDRDGTSMKDFIQCEMCRKEYDSPNDRRFHAQPNACRRCGPAVRGMDAAGRSVQSDDDAVRKVSQIIADGGIVAVKGIGGFHLMVDARSDEAVTRLRGRKSREEKPFAIMVPTLQCAHEIAEISSAEERLLSSPAAPITLLARRSTNRVSDVVAPSNSEWGILLPYTPLHHLILSDIAAPVVATSGNRSEEPICIENNDALSRLGGIADYFLIHNRRIVRPVDDSVARVVAGQEQLFRRSRGYAPRPVFGAVSGGAVIGLGPHMKNSITLVNEGHAVVSQHLGDLDSLESVQVLKRTSEDMQSLFNVRPRLAAVDMHPAYATTGIGQKQFPRCVAVQHHHAHVVSCMVEHGLKGPVLGVAWDGTGYGTDGSVWGGEFLIADRGSFDRGACIRPFRLPGGEAAVRRPRHAALGILHALYGGRLPELPWIPSLGFSPAQRDILLRALDRKINAPLTTSMGRLFDAVAALAGVREETAFEGQAAMALEHIIGESASGPCYNFTEASKCEESPTRIYDWGPMIEKMLWDRQEGLLPGDISLGFHDALVKLIVAEAKRAERPHVVLTGGCFQSRYLTERAVDALRSAGFIPWWHRQVPPNDGGISLGQAVIATAVSTDERKCDGHVPCNTR
jgi:hydrogenase maturation protein HypF